MNVDLEQRRARVRQAAETAVNDPSPANFIAFAGAVEVEAELHKRLLRRGADALDKLHKQCLEKDAELTRLRAEVEKLTKERDHWKANHSNVAWQKGVLQDRPDLKDRAASMLRKDAELTRLREELTALRAVADAAEAFYIADADHKLDTVEEEGYRRIMDALAAAKDANKPTKEKQHG